MKLLSKFVICLLMIGFVFSCGENKEDIVTPTVTITSFTPNSGPVGTEITITGTGFSTTASENQVNFNGTNATVMSSTATTISTEVPTGATTGSITVVVDGQTATSNSNFMVTSTLPTAPTISSFSPMEGSEGTVVTITGTNFSTTATENGVSFNGTNATINSATSTSLEVEVPQGATTGAITVTVAGESVTSSNNFTVNPPLSILNFSPTTGVAGTTVVITGTGFSATSSANMVLFGGVQATVTAASTTSLTVEVPEFAFISEISVEVDNQTVLSAEKFIPQDSWTSIANFPSVREIAVSFAIGDKGYVGTGFGGDGNNNRKDFWEYDPATDTWSQKADFGGAARSRAVGFVTGNRGYIGTGQPNISSGQSTNDFWAYNPNDNTWTKVADFPGGAITHGAAFAINGKGYVGTGFGGSSRTKDFWEYDPATDTWTQKADFGGVGREQAIGFAIGGKGFIGTGTSGGSTRLADFWEYDPATDTWTQKADFGGGLRSFTAGFVIGNKGYVGTGVNSSSSRVSDFYEYNPTTDTWTQRASFRAGNRFAGTGFAIGNRGYIGIGSDGSPVNEFYQYVPIEDN